MRPFFIGLSISLGFSINPLVMAQHAGAQIQDRIHNFDFQKEDIESLIHLLLMKDKITDVQAMDALLRLGELSEEEIKHLTMDALQNFQNADGEELSAMNAFASNETSFFFDSTFEVNCFETDDESKNNPTAKKSKKYQ